jgi:hypothetical protein
VTPNIAAAMPAVEEVHAELVTPGPANQGEPDLEEVPPSAA